MASSSIDGGLSVLRPAMSGASSSKNHLESMYSRSLVPDAPSYRDNSEENSDDAVRPSGYEKSHNTEFTESTLVPRRSLGYIQTTCLMLNGCLGGNWFFTTPYYTLALVRSKRVCLALWAVGGIYSALGIILSMEYGTALPFTGGALLYLDETFHRPRLLVTVVFSFWWILFQGTQGFSKIMAEGIISLTTGHPGISIDIRLLKFTAVVVQTVVCLLLFFARRLCFAFNIMAVAYKIMLLLVIFAAGMVASRWPSSGWSDFNVEYPGYNGKDALTAMVYIILAYQGWDNANYVTGEVKHFKRTLKWAGVTTILILAILNILVTMALFAVGEYAQLTTKAGKANSALLFAEIVFGNSKGMQIALLLCTFTAMVYRTYTISKVKQAIAWQRIIPFHQFFGRQDLYYDSPGGALFLHWIFSVAAILACGAIPEESRVFFTGIYAFGYQLLFVFLGIGLLKLKARMRLQDEKWKPTYLTNRFYLVSIAVIFSSWNVVTLVMTSLPKNLGATPRFWWPISAAIVTAAALLYWAGIRLLEVRGDKQKRQSLGAKLGFEIHIWECDDNVPDEMKFPMYEAELDGSRRRLQYKRSGLVDRFATGCRKVVNTLDRVFVS